MSEIESRGYSVSEVLVSTDWVQKHAKDPSVRVVESNEDPLLYRTGHIPGAFEVDWTRDLNDPLRRDYLHAEEFVSLMGRIGATPDTTFVFYGDKNNWWACYAFWVFSLFGHRNLKIMDGGRRKWEIEGRSLDRHVPVFAPTKYPTPWRNDETERAFRDDVLRHLSEKKPMIDVRSPEEYRGEKLHMENYPNEGALRGGHIPGAKNVPWARAVSPNDGTFLPADVLRQIYFGEADLNPNAEVVTYCRIGERSSHTWFVLRFLLGLQKVRNYDGSWTEWGNLVNVPIER